ncbi:MAG: hypothetical protein HY924_15505 [Elusimicrobia bacterium]|nr:hypothetical protein [Elusimicrobiota bacterium]
MRKMDEGRPKQSRLAAACAVLTAAELVCLALLADPRERDGPGEAKTPRPPSAFIGERPLESNGAEAQAAGEEEATEEADSWDVRDAVAQAHAGRAMAELSSEPEILTEWWLLKPGGAGRPPSVERKSGEQPAPASSRRLTKTASEERTAPRQSRARQGASAAPGAPPKRSLGTDAAVTQASGRISKAPGPEAWPGGRKPSPDPGPEARQGQAGRPWRDATWKSRRASSGASRLASPALPKGVPKPALRPPLFRPILLSALLGKNAIRPPKGKVAVPDLSSLAQRLPRTLPDGTPLVLRHPEPGQVEAQEPPDPRAWSSAGPCPKPAHWHGRAAGALEAAVLHYHDGTAWGRWDKGSWTWHVRKDARWWVSAGPKLPTLLRHGKHWWWQASGLWFLLHQGEPWGYRQLTDLGLDSLVHPGTGTSMVYSSDGRRLALITPGQGAVLFDAEHGTVLGRWTEGEMPKPRRPSAPTSLSFPP